MRSIHIHAHLTPQCFWRATEDGGGWHTLRREKNARGQECAMVGGRRQPLPPRAKWTPEERLADMDSLGVDVQVDRWNCVALRHSANRIMSMVDCGVTPAYHGRRMAPSQMGKACAERRRVAMARGDTITVLNPMGYPPKVTHKPMAPRLETLDGRTVYLVDCRFDDADIFLKQMQAWFTEHMPNVRTVLKPISNVYTKDDPTTWAEIKANGDAAIIGVGH
jgi:hypothetical protein